MKVVPDTTLLDEHGNLDLQAAAFVAGAAQSDFECREMFAEEQLVMDYEENMPALLEVVYYALAELKLLRQQVGRESNTDAA